VPTKPAKVALSSDTAEAEVKLAVNSDGALMVDESGKCLDDMTITVESSEQDGCVREADSTDRQETSCDSGKRKRGRQRKSGSKLLSLRRQTLLHDEDVLLFDSMGMQTCKHAMLTVPAADIVAVVLVCHKTVDNIYRLTTSCIVVTQKLTRKCGNFDALLFHSIFTAYSVPNLSAIQQSVAELCNFSI